MKNDGKGLHYNLHNAWGVCTHEDHVVWTGHGGTIHVEPVELEKARS